jgi:hypothetical protein
MINKNENNIFADFITECLVEEKSDISQLILNCYK